MFDFSKSIISADDLQEERAQRLFDHLIDQQLLIFPKIDNADLEGVCKWHMTELHTTDKCQTFRAFVARLVQKGKLPLLPIDGGSFGPW